MRGDDYAPRQDTFDIFGHYPYGRDVSDAEANRILVVPDNEHRYGIGFGFDEVVTGMKGVMLAPLAIMDEDNTLNRSPVWTIMEAATDNQLRMVRNKMGRGVARDEDIITMSQFYSWWLSKEASAHQGVWGCEDLAASLRSYEKHIVNLRVPKNSDRLFIGATFIPRDWGLIRVREAGKVLTRMRKGKDKDLKSAAVPEERKAIVGRLPPRDYSPLIQGLYEKPYKVRYVNTRLNEAAAMIETRMRGRHIVAPRDRDDRADRHQDDREQELQRSRAFERGDTRGYDRRDNDHDDRRGDRDYDHHDERTGRYRDDRDRETEKETILEDPNKRRDRNVDEDHSETELLDRDAFGKDSWSTTGSGRGSNRDSTTSKGFKRKNGGRSNENGLEDPADGKRSREDEDQDQTSGSRHASDWESDRLRLQKQLAEAQQTISKLKTAQIAAQKQGPATSSEASTVAPGPGGEKTITMVPKRKKKAKAKKQRMATQPNPMMDAMAQFMNMMASMQSQMGQQEQGTGDSDSDSCGSMGVELLLRRRLDTRVSRRNSLTIKYNVNLCNFG
ncbi:hypothetical protein J8273_1497 [Carpediemonas membranifera]|uniref:Uncharacterized protein n=1 Tax=Carpediemonas membranifera TaxID=201153 RepID=A0A8J6EB80_9EUKA|nr:hypothetical protein J8273_1497 [Carpediemonas membranifera]|eukprot:KAG9396505.1 hypothetical protein J8273_1497 [Carpediemonas membranifera]